MIYTILTSDLESFSKKIKHITKKCEKAGVPFIFEIRDSYKKRVQFSPSKIYTLELTHVEVDAHFVFNGWKSLGVVSRKDGIVQCFFKDSELIKQYKDTDFHCDHCHKKVSRNSVVILEHENGERKIVGTSCVKEFTKGLDGNLIAEFADFTNILNDEEKLIIKALGFYEESEKTVADIDEEFFKDFIKSNGVIGYSVKDIVACASSLIEAYGFEPTCSFNATWKQILSTYEENDYSEYNKLEAEKAIDWIASLTDDEYIKNNYLFNLRQIVDAGYCTMRHFGILASLIPAYKKEMAKNIQKEKSKSNFVGNIGDKIAVEVSILKSISYESVYGGGFFHIFMDADGNVFKWNTKKYLRDKDCGYKDLEQGDKIFISGTIKDHDEYRGEKQTVITRCKFSVIKEIA